MNEGREPRRGAFLQQKDGGRVPKHCERHLSMQITTLLRQMAHGVAARDEESVRVASKT